MDSQTALPVYASFDRVPAPKGAAGHIAAFVRALGIYAGRIELFTVADGDSTREPGLHSSFVSHRSLPAVGDHLVERVLCFRSHFMSALGDTRRPFIHVRSPFEGYPVAKHGDRYCRRFVFEVNALPSIELPIHYPSVNDDHELLRKLRFQERICLERADLVLTPSPVTARFLHEIGVEESKTLVIPNGVDPAQFPDPRARPSNMPFQIFYAGTLADWQGVDVAIEALSHLNLDPPARLLIVGPGTVSKRRSLREKARELRIENLVRILDPVRSDELVRLYHHSHVAVVPLKPDPRNVIQGCCPLKILEAMATGTPIIASDFASIRALVSHEREALLVLPGDSHDLARALRRVAAEPSFATDLAAAARARVEARFTWKHAESALINAYRTHVEPHI